MRGSRGQLQGVEVLEAMTVVLDFRNKSAESREASLCLGTATEWQRPAVASTVYSKVRTASAGKRVSYHRSINTFRLSIWISTLRQ